MKIALFESAGDQYQMVGQQWRDGSDPHFGESYVRVSEYIDVTFSPRDRGEIVSQQVAIIDETIVAVTQDFAQKLDALKTRKQELMALTHEVQP